MSIDVPRIPFNVITIIMIISKSDYSKLAANFDLTLAHVAEAMDGADLEWFVVAGWALELFIDKKHREHKDIEISIWRDEVPLLLKHFAKHRVDMVVGHKRYETLGKDSVIDKRGHLIIRDISIKGHIFDIELFTTERIGNNWIFKKQVEVQSPVDEAILTASCGTRYLAPQFVLLFKAWFHPTLEQALLDLPEEAHLLRQWWETDCTDFQLILPLLSDSQSDRLYCMLKRFTPDIPWLESF